ncbi:MAG: ABC transporter permease [Balneolaceae bacterium]|nr:MAG: ABC transporter permease [Balneolaceae bacterium]
MTIFRITLKNLRQRPLSTLLTILSVTLGAGLVIAVMVVQDETERNFRQTTNAYNMIIAAKGSPMQSYLNTMYHLETSTGIIPYGVYETAKNDPRVEYAFPFYVGDSYRGHRVIGTSLEFLTSGTPRAGQVFEFAEGRPFVRPFEAVLGSDAAKSTGLRTGDTFHFTHGVLETAGPAEAHIHDDTPVTVTGILKRTGTAHDRAIYSSVETTHAAHDHNVHFADHSHASNHDSHGQEHSHDNGHSHASSHVRSHDDRGQNHDHDHDHGHSHDQNNGSTHDDHDHNHNAGDHPNHDHDHHKENGVAQDHHLDHEQLTYDSRGITVTNIDAVLLRIGNDAAALQLAGMINYPTPDNPMIRATQMRDPFFRYKDGIMAVIPAAQMSSLMGIIGNAEQILRIIAYLVMIVGLTGVLVSIFNTMDSRKRDIAIMRALGAGRKRILVLIMLEAAFITLAGCILGLLAGHTIVAAAAPVLADMAGIYVKAFAITAEQIYVLLIFVFTGTILGLVPAFKAYRTEVTTNLITV